MPTSKPTPLGIEDFIKSATMFYIDPELEKEFDDAVEKDVKEIKTELLGITTEEGLQKYIRETPESLDRITSVLNISEEKFKRIITMLRIHKGFTPTSEWSMGALRVQMIESPDWMSMVSRLLMYGRTLKEYQELIPEFYLTNFSIDATTIGRLADDDDIRRLVKKGYEGKYNNRIGDSFFNKVSTSITKKCDREGLTYAIKEIVPFAEKQISIAIPDVKNPRLMIDVTYGITTSSTQTRLAKEAEAICSKLRDKNQGKSDKEKTLYISIIDGAGWVARQSDLNKIHRCSDYLINLNSIGMMDTIIEYYL